MNRQEAIDIIYEAQEKLNEVIEALDGVARELNDGHADAYMVVQLKVLASKDSGYLSNDFNLDQWIADLEEEDAESQVEDSEAEDSAAEYSQDEDEADDSQDEDEE